LERKRYEAETAYISDYQEIKNNQSEKTGIYEYSSLCSAGMKAGWLGYSEKNDLQWRDVYSTNGGEYELTIGFISGENRSITVSVNGTKVKTFSVNSGAWDKVGTRKLAIKLEKGINTIRLSNPSNWMPDIDYMELLCTEEADEINSPKTEHPQKEACYDLQGKKVNGTDARGVIIQEGRKVIKGRH
jgi:hypothetical protein